MKLLALETSSNACSVALQIDQQIFSRHEVAPIQQAKLVLPMIEAVLREASITLQDMDAIAFGCGPGSFTGVRIATSVAQGLAFGANVPMIRISSLACMAQAAFEASGQKQLVIAMDARMHEIYWGAYQVNAQGLVELVGEERVSPASELHVPAHFVEWAAIGNAWEVYQDSLVPAPGFKDVSQLPTATGLLILAESDCRAKKFCLPEDAVPVYLRDNVALKESERKK